MRHDTTRRTSGTRFNALAACVLAALGAATLGQAGVLDAARTPSPVLAPEILSDLDVARLQRGVPRPTAVPARPDGVPTVIVVSTCADAGSGSLRQALLDAVDGASIDLTGLGCSTITLTTGALETAKTVTLLGPGEAELTIDGGGVDRVLRSVSPSLSIQDLTLANGSAQNVGGCLYASGAYATGADVTLTRTTVVGCSAGSANAPRAYGGGIYVRGNVEVIDSTITGNTALAAGNASGAGVFSKGPLSLTDSVVTDNVASGDSAIGGGVFGNSTLTLSNTRLSDNLASGQTYAGGGGAAAWVNLTMADGSLVSGNTAAAISGIGTGGGLLSRHGSVFATGSNTGHPLITGNRAESMGGGSAYGGGIASSYFGLANTSLATISDNTVYSANNYAGGGGLWAYRVTLNASTVSGNTASCAAADCLSLGGGAGTWQGGLEAKYSTIRGNGALASSLGAASGGGLAAFAGGLSLIESTVSGNTATGDADISYGGGVLARHGDVLLQNSTIAFNSAGTQGGGIAVGIYSYTFTSTSTILSNNTAPAGADIDVSPVISGTPFIVAGDHNLIVSAGADVTLPNDTLTTDAMLLPLASNGGSTATHALAACSPAISTGSNPASLNFDQRKDATVRTHGFFTDIGAFEVQPTALEADRIFSDLFERTPSCP